MNWWAQFQLAREAMARLLFLVLVPFGLALDTEESCTLAVNQVSLARNSWTPAEAGGYCKEVGGSPGGWLIESNTVQFSHSSVKRVEASLMQYAVTTGQRVSKECLSTSGGDLTFRCGKKASEGPAGAFMDSMSGESMLGTGQTLPQLLDFAFEAEVKVFFEDGSASDALSLSFAQGSFEGRSMWFIGSQECYRKTSDTLYCGSLCFQVNDKLKSNEFQVYLCQSANSSK